MKWSSSTIIVPSRSFRSGRIWTLGAGEAGGFALGGATVAEAAEEAEVADNAGVQGRGGAPSRAFSASLAARGSTPTGGAVPGCVSKPPVRGRDSPRRALRSAWRTSTKEG